MQICSTVEQRVSDCFDDWLAFDWQGPRHCHINVVCAALGFGSCLLAVSTPYYILLSTSSSAVTQQSAFSSYDCVKMYKEQRWTSEMLKRPERRLSSFMFVIACLLCIRFLQCFGTLLRFLCPIPPPTRLAQVRVDWYWNNAWQADGQMMTNGAIFGASHNL